MRVSCTAPNTVHVLEAVIVTTWVVLSATLAKLLTAGGPGLNATFEALRYSNLSYTR